MTVSVSFRNHIFLASDLGLGFLNSDLQGLGRYYLLEQWHKCNGLWDWFLFVCKYVVKNFLTLCQNFQSV